MENDILSLQQGWDYAAFELQNPDEAQSALTALEAQAAALSASNPRVAELLALRGLAAATRAGLSEGLDALQLAKQAKGHLEQAIALNPNPLGDGLAYAVLGALYAQVPGFPIGFGDKKRARFCLEQALAQSPNGIDSNYFWAEHLLDTGHPGEARAALDKALRAPARPGRASADLGRRRDIAELRARIDAKLAAR